MSFSREMIEDIKNRLQNHTEAHFEIPFLLQDTDIFELVEILKARPDIQSLDLSGSNIKDKGALKLAELKHLTHLDVRGGKFHNDYALALILNIKNLVWINLSDNRNLNDDLGNKILSGCVNHVVVVIDTPTMSMKMRAAIRDHYKNLGKEKTSQAHLAKEKGEDTTLDQKQEHNENTSQTTSTYAQLRLSGNLEEKKESIPQTTSKSSQSSSLKEPEENKLGSPRQLHVKKTTSVFNWFNWFSKRNVVASIENRERDNLIKLR